MSTFPRPERPTIQKVRQVSALVRPARAARRVLGGAALGAALACVPPGDGVAPPFDRFYFPVALALEEASDHLLVIGSDFDLQFNQGTIHSLNLRRVRDLLPSVCSDDDDCPSNFRCDDEPAESNEGRPSFFCVAASGAERGQPCPRVGLKAPSLRATSPGICAPEALEVPEAVGQGLITDIVQVSAFATDAILLSRPSDAPRGADSRLFVPVRGDSSLHWFNVDEGRFECGQSEARGVCSDDFAVRRNPGTLFSVNPRIELLVPPDPYEVTASRDGSLIAMTHQTTGQVSAFSHDWAEGPVLVSLVRGLPGNPLGIAPLPVRRDPSSASGQSQPGFLTTFRDRAEVHLLRYVPGTDVIADERDGSATSGPALVDVARVGVTLNASGVHSRGIVVDSQRRDAAIAACGAGDDSCRTEAERVALDVYVANRTPSSLLLGKTSGPSDLGGPSDVPAFYDNIPLTEGPSGVFVGKIMTAGGRVESRVFVTCFDSSVIYVIDPERRLIESQIFTGRGPQSIAFQLPDSGPSNVGALAYIAHFTDSYVSVVSLDQRFPKTFGATLATLGTPTPPRASK